MVQRSRPESNARRYRERAAELRDIASITKDDDIRQELLLIAVRYEKLAADVERKARER